MGLMKLKKNKKYNYKPRYYKGDGSPYELNISLMTTEHGKSC